MYVYKAEVHKAGRITIQIEIRKQFQIAEGDILTIRQENEEQRKIIKYNHLVSNCLIFYNVFEISRILQEYIQARNTIEKEILGAL